MFLISNTPASIPTHSRKISPHFKSTGRPKLFLRGSVYYFRQSIPKDLLPLFQGRKLFSKSLKVKDYKQAGTPFMLLSAKTDKLFLNLRCLLEIAPMTELTKLQIQEMVRDYFQEKLEDSEEDRVLHSRNIENNIGLSLVLPDLIENETGMLATANYKNVEGEMEGVLKGQLVDKFSHDFLARELIKARIELLKTDLKRVEGNYSSEMKYLYEKPSKPKVKSKLLSEVMDLRLKEIKIKEKAKKTIIDTKSIYSILLRILGDKEITSYTYEDIMKASETLKTLPKSVTTDKKLKGMSISKVLKMDIEGMPKYAPKTVHNDLMHLNQLFNFMVERRWIPNSPCPKWEKSKELKRNRGPDPFSKEDLEKLFKSPFYSDPSFKQKKPQCYWIPLISLYAGLRIDEACQLYREDILEVDGIQCFSINDDKDKKVKTDTSIRNIPIHPKLIELGFLDYAKNVTTERLWSQLKMGPNGYSHYFSRLFGIYKRKHISNDHKKVFHSLRKTFARTLNEAGISDELIGALLGHSPKNKVTEIYTGKKPVKILNDVIVKLAYDIQF